ncbi:MAG: nucleotide-binding universal stress UspA family protein, partial [Glaciecola sp.]
NDAPHLVRHILVPISSVEMAHRKAPQVVDLASSTGATLSALHISRPGQAAPEAEAALQAVARLAAKRGVQCEQIFRESESVVDAIVDVARVAAVDLVIIGEPATRALDRGGGRRIVHEVAERLPSGVRLIVIPTILRADQRKGRSLSSELAESPLAGFEQPRSD